MNEQQSPEQPANPSAELTSTAPAGTISRTALLAEKPDPMQWNNYAGNRQAEKRKNEPCYGL